MIEPTILAPLHTKSPPTTLEVRIGSDVFSHPKAAKVFCQTIEAMGLEKVQQLGLTASALPLVSLTSPATRRGFMAVGKYFVVTHSSTREKKATLEQAAEMLKIPIQVRIISKDEVQNALLNELLADLEDN